MTKYTISITPDDANKKVRNYDDVAILSENEAKEIALKRFFKEFPHYSRDPNAYTVNLVSPVE